MPVQNVICSRAICRALLEYGRLYAGRSGRPDLLRFLRDHLAGGDGSDYGSDTDAEPEPEPELTGLDREGTSVHGAVDNGPSPLDFIHKG